MSIKMEPRPGRGVVLGDREPDAVLTPARALLAEARLLLAKQEAALKQAKEAAEEAQRQADRAAFWNCMWGGLCVLALLIVLIKDVVAGVVAGA